MAQINFGGVVENVATREEFPLDKAREVLKDETIAVLGYGIQGPGQACNLRDNGFNVIVGQRQGKTYEKCVADGWVPGKTLFSIEEAAEKGTIVCMLLSDAAQIEVWPKIKQKLTPGKALYFSHGIAEERTMAIGIGIGSGYMFKTDFKREVYSDLTGERGALMGAVQGMFLAQYETLREHGHTPSEAFNETVEEFTQSLLPMVGKNGMDWMYANCSTTAQRGALDWMGPFHDAINPVMEKLYNSVATGNEAQISIDSNSKPDYREKLNAELKALHDSEMWRTGETVRKLRPENN